MLLQTSPSLCFTPSKSSDISHPELANVMNLHPTSLSSGTPKLILPFGERLEQLPEPDFIHTGNTMWWAHWNDDKNEEANIFDSNGFLTFIFHLIKKIQLYNLNFWVKSSNLKAASCQKAWLPESNKPDSTRHVNMPFKKIPRMYGAEPSIL